MGYNIISLESICDSIGKENTKKVVSNFECKLNKDVEYFLKETAIEFVKQDIAKTFIITSSYKQEQVIVGYFAISIKSIRIKKKLLSCKLRKRISRFADKDSIEEDYYTVTLPLIGQIGKNFKNGYNELIDGDVLLQFACDKIKEVQEIIGGRFVFLECEDIPKLKEFYESNGFVYFDKRNLDRDERKHNQGEYLLQMLRDLSNFKKTNTN